MKIFYFISSLKNSGGIERIVVTKANYLSTHFGYDISIVTSDHKGERSFYKLEKNIRIIELDINYSKGLLYPILIRVPFYVAKQIIHYKKISKLINYENPDVIISTFGFEMSIIASLKTSSIKILEFHFSKYFRIKEVISSKKNKIWILAEKIRSYYNNSKIKKYNKFVVLTEQDKKLWLNLKNIVVINNFIYCKPEIRSDLQNKNVLAVGRLSKQKGFDLLIDIWKDIAKKLPDWKLIIVGSGEMEKDIIKKIDTLNLQNSITLKKPTSNISNYYLNTSIYVMTSRYEGMPMVLLEAKSYGLPIVSYSCESGPAEIIRNNIDGFLIPETKKNEFVNKLSVLMNNKQLRIKMGKETQEDIDRFSQTDIMNKWKTLFETLLKENVI